MVSFFGTGSNCAECPATPPKLLKSRGLFQTPLRAVGAPAEVILVAIDAGAKPISKQAVEWAVTNIAQEGDCITLLAIVLVGYSGEKVVGTWKFCAQFSNQCGSFSTKRHGDGSVKKMAILERQVSQNCTDMLQQINKQCEAKKVKITVNIMPVTVVRGTVASQAAKLKASWVVLDRRLRKEERYCLGCLECSVVVVSKNQVPRILRLNLKGPMDRRTRGEEDELESFSVISDGLSFSDIPMGFQAYRNTIGHQSKANRRLESKVLNGTMVADASFDMSSMTMPPFTPSDCETSPSSVGSECVFPCDGVAQKRQQSTFSALDSWITHNRGTKKESIASVSTQVFEYTNTPEQSSPQAAARTIPGSINHMEVLIPGGSRWSNESVLSSAASGPVSRSSSGRKSLDSCELDASALALKTSLMSLHPNHQKKLSTTFGTQVEPISTRLLSQLLSSPMTCSVGCESPLDFDRNTVKYPGKEPVCGEGELHKTNLSNHSVPAHESSEHSIGVYVNAEKAISGTTTSLFNTSFGAPPLCSICQNKAPAFGKPAIQFTYAELQKATGNFSKENFLAEGGFGPVHKGILQPGGHKVAVKQHRQASTQGDKEFSSEVEVLGCAQHRNVVMLMGYCIEGGRRMLVYEYVCNGSLDSHLFNQNNLPMEWKWRQKVAIGAARGLRFLHEDCRVGCIVHRDLRPNNILLTHDFEPQVGDFGLARCQPDGQLEEETRVLGTFGYLAPEYAQTGQLTEKADVYSFGVILLELITGRKAIDYFRPKGQQCLTEWARPLVDDHIAYELIDPRLENRFNEYEAYCMLHAAALCIRRDPHTRPRMSQVLRILEGDVMGVFPVPFGCSTCNVSAAAPGTRSPDELSMPPAMMRQQQQLGGMPLIPAMQLPPLNVTRAMFLNSRPSSGASSPTTPASFRSGSPPSTTSTPRLSRHQNGHINIRSGRHNNHREQNPTPDSPMKMSGAGCFQQRP